MKIGPKSYVDLCEWWCFQEDDEQTIEQDEALITKEERQEELAALRDEMDIPIEELLKRYAGEKGEIYLFIY